MDWKRSLHERIDRRYRTFFFLFFSPLEYLIDYENYNTLFYFIFLSLTVGPTAILLHLWFNESDYWGQQTQSIKPFTTTHTNAVVYDDTCHRTVACDAMIESCA